MIIFILGLLALAVFMGALGMFSRAQISDIKRFGAWTAALGGLALGALLLLTGRGAVAVSALMFLGPLVWQWMAPKVAAPGAKPRPRAAPGSMTRAEALEILGLKAGASETDIRAAYHRLMRAAHPDAGGSDWLAARINQARDALLG
jgi:DnaJ family protein C protein 19